MCERYVLPRQEDAEREFVPAHCWWKFVPSFNVAFPQYVPVLRRHEGAIEGVMMRWGLVPASAEGRAAPERIRRASISSGSGRRRIRAIPGWRVSGDAFCRWRGSMCGT